MTWVLFALCLVIAFAFGYFVRGTAQSPTQTAKTTQTVTAVNSTSEVHATSSIATTTVSTVQTTTFKATTTHTTSASQTTTPTAKPQQTTTPQATASHTTAAQTTSSTAQITYILNTSSKKIHYPSCSSANKILDKNRGEHTGDYTELLSQGYTTCGICFK